jgi:hypothetical protein
MAVKRRSGAQPESATLMVDPRQPLMIDPAGFGTQVSGPMINWNNTQVMDDITVDIFALAMRDRLAAVEVPLDLMPPVTTGAGLAGEVMLLGVDQSVELAMRFAGAPLFACSERCNQRMRAQRPSQAGPITFDVGDAVLAPWVDQPAVEGSNVTWVETGGGIAQLAVIDLNSPMGEWRIITPHAAELTGDVTVALPALPAPLQSWLTGFDKATVKLVRVVPERTYAELIPDADFQADELGPDSLDFYTLDTDYVVISGVP